MDVQVAEQGAARLWLGRGGVQGQGGQRGHGPEPTRQDASGFHCPCRR